MERQRTPRVNTKRGMHQKIEKIMENQIQLQETERQTRVSSKRAALIEMFNQDSIALPKSCQIEISWEDSTEMRKTPSLLNDSFGCEKFESSTDQIDNEISSYPSTEATKPSPPSRSPEQFRSPVHGKNRLSLIDKLTARAITPTLSTKARSPAGNRSPIGITAQRSAQKRRVSPKPTSFSISGTSTLQIGKSFSQPEKPTNKRVIKAAIGTQKVITALKPQLIEFIDSADDSCFVLIVNESTLRIIGLYRQEYEQLFHILGWGPDIINWERVSKGYRYDSTQNKFVIVKSASIAMAIDAVSLRKI